MLLSKDHIKGISIALRKVESSLVDVIQNTEKDDNLNVGISIDVKHDKTDMLNFQLREQIRQTNQATKSCLNMDVVLVCQIKLSQEIDTKKMKDEDLILVGNIVQPFITELVANLSSRMGRSPLILPENIERLKEMKDGSNTDPKK
ncbi:MAG: hypothetical protein AABX82_06780 [Nanoarchaeota archaeon]